MSSEELLWIKNIQKQFKNRFKKHLHIDWTSQKGIDTNYLSKTAMTIYQGRRKPVELFGAGERLTCTPEDYFRQVCDEYGVKPDEIKYVDGYLKKGSKERLAVLRFVVESCKQEWPSERVAQIINKNRTLVNHYLYTIYDKEKHLIGM